MFIVLYILLCSNIFLNVPIFYNLLSIIFSILALLGSCLDWTRALDEGYGLDVVFLDYRKAFDNVPH